MPRRPKMVTDCGPSTSTTVGLVDPCGCTSATAVSCGSAGRAPNTWSSTLPSVAGIDVADSGDAQGCPGHDALAVVVQIVASDGLEGVRRARDGPRIGMPAERLRHPLGVGQLVVVAGLEAGTRQQLGARALQDGGIEQRPGDGEPQQLGGLVQVLRQRLEIAEECVAVGVEGQSAPTACRSASGRPDSTGRPRPGRAWRRAGRRCPPCPSAPARCRRRIRSGWR